MLSGSAGDHPASTARYSNEQSKKQRRKIANQVRHRLKSIRYDERFVQHTLSRFDRSVPVIANERCGSWYTASPHLSCYFKSTDGHAGTWNFSLKRLNLNVIRSVAETTSTSVIILDASQSKELPDSFSRTIPIWAAVMNRIAARYREEMGLLPELHENWDTNLYTPDFCISEQEHAQIESILNERVERLYHSQAIVNPAWLASTLLKPLRPFWITPQRQDCDYDRWTSTNDDCCSLICVNCSELHPRGGVWKAEEHFQYSSGAADDHESWARKLTPRLFWENVEAILDIPDTEEGSESVIDALVQRERHQNAGCGEETKADIIPARHFDIVGNTSLAVGSRRAGRPPLCWQHFDAVLNVTGVEYPDMLETCSDKRFYLQLPVKEGKRDRSELEQWMAVGVVFVFLHAVHNGRRVLIHCAQGKDRSVAIAMAVVAIFCDLKFPLQWKDGVRNLSLDTLCEGLEAVSGTKEEEIDICCRSSGLSLLLVRSMKGRDGRDRLHDWVRKELCAKDCADLGRTFLATKETLRVALLLIQQDREKADPSRSTMQKINRFFMSRTFDRTV